MFRRIFRTIRWHLGLAGGRPKKGERLVQIAPMLNCPLWGVTTTDQCAGCPYFRGTCLPAPKSLLPTIRLVKCSYDGRLIDPESRLVAMRAKEGVDAVVVRCISCGDPYLERAGVDVPVCSRLLCMSRALLSGKGTLRSSRGDTINDRRRKNAGDAGSDEGEDDDAGFTSFRPRQAGAQGGQEAGEGLGEGHRGP